MGVPDQSFAGKPSFQAFTGTAFQSRGPKGDLVFVGTFLFADSSKDVNDVGFLGKAQLEKIGENESFSVGTINDIIEFADGLYVGGDFDGGARSLSGIAKLTESEGIWEQVEGTDLTLLFETDGIKNFIVFDGALVLVGGFDDANGVANTLNLAGWDETNYFAFGDIVGDIDSAGLIFDCATFGDELVVSGTFGNSDDIPDLYILGFWDGATWTVTGVASGDQQPHPPHYMLEFDTDLYCSFPDAGAMSKWTGAAWVVVAAIGAIKAAFGNGNIVGMVVFEGELVVSGSFDEINSTAFNNVAKWDGTTFLAMGSGLGTSTAQAVFDVWVHEKRLYAIGLFTENGEGDDVVGLAVWNKSTEVWDQAYTATAPTTVSGRKLYTFDGKLNGMLP